MSLYLGKDASLSNILHITNTSISESTMKELLLQPTPNTVFHTKLPITRIVYEEEVVLPSISSPYEVNSVSVSTVLSSYFGNPFYNCYILLDNLYYYPCSLQNVFMLSVGGEYSIVSGNSSLAGKICKIIVTVSEVLSQGSIYIGNNIFTIGSNNIASYKFFTVTNSSSGYLNSNQLSDGTYLSLIDVTASNAVRLVNDGLEYRLPNMAWYSLISQNASSRVHTFYSNSAIASITNTSIGETLVSVLPFVPNDQVRLLQMKIPINYFYGEGLTTPRPEYVFNGYLTFFTYTNSDFYIDKKIAAFLRCRFSYNATTRTLNVTLYPVTNEVEVSYIGNNSVNVYYTVV